MNEIELDLFRKEGEDLWDKDRSVGGIWRRRNLKETQKENLEVGRRNSKEKTGLKRKEQENEWSEGGPKTTGNCSFHVWP